MVALGIRPVALLALALLRAVLRFALILPFLCLNSNIAMAITHLPLYPSYLVVHHFHFALWLHNASTNGIFISCGGCLRHLNIEPKLMFLLNSYSNSPLP